MSTDVKGFYRDGGFRLCMQSIQERKDKVSKVIQDEIEVVFNQSDFLGLNQSLTYVYHVVLSRALTVLEVTMETWCIDSGSPPDQWIENQFLPILKAWFKNYLSLYEDVLSAEMVNFLQNKFKTDHLGFDEIQKQFFECYQMFMGWQSGSGED